MLKNQSFSIGKWTNFWNGIWIESLGFLEYKTLTPLLAVTAIRLSIYINKSNEICNEKNC